MIEAPVSTISALLQPVPFHRRKLVEQGVVGDGRYGVDDVIRLGVNDVGILGKRLHSLSYAETVRQAPVFGVNLGPGLDSSGAQAAARAIRRGAPGARLKADEQFVGDKFVGRMDR